MIGRFETHPLLPEGCGVIWSPLPKREEECLALVAFGYRCFCIWREADGQLLGIADRATTHGGLVNQVLYRGPSRDEALKAIAGRVRLLAALPSRHWRAEADALAGEEFELWEEPPAPWRMLS